MMIKKIDLDKLIRQDNKKNYYFGLYIVSAFCNNRLGPILLSSGPLSCGSRSWGWLNSLVGPCYKPAYAQAIHSKDATNETCKTESWTVVRWSSYSRRKWSGRIADTVEQLTQQI